MLDDAPGVSSPVGHRLEERLVEDDDSRAGTRAAAVHDLNRHRLGHEAPVEGARFERVSNGFARRLAASREREGAAGGHGIGGGQQGEQRCQQDQMTARRNR